MTGNSGRALGQKYQKNQMTSNDPSLIFLNSIQIVGWAEEFIMLHFAASWVVTACVCPCTNSVSLVAAAAPAEE